MQKKRISPPDLSVQDDGLFTPEVGDWAEEKYRLLWCYADLFATSMKKKWDERCYIDLYAGSGYARIRGTTRIVQSSSLLALQVTDPFDCYIFCDSDPRCYSSLETRARRLKPEARCFFLNCDVNTSSADIISHLPPHGPNHKVLSFCFIDPCKISDIKFSTLVKELSSRFVDFLIHVPAMDPKRTEHIHLQKDTEAISNYLGTTAWKEERKRGDPTVKFDLYIAQEIDKQMKSLRYVYGGISESIMIRSTKRNLPLYRLIFYSRHPLGARFWKEAIKYSDPQMSLF